MLDLAQAFHTGGDVASFVLLLGLWRLDRRLVKLEADVRLLLRGRALR